MKEAQSGKSLSTLTSFDIIVPTVSESAGIGDTCEEVTHIITVIISAGPFRGHQAEEHIELNM